MTKDDYWKSKNDFQMPKSSTPDFQKWKLYSPPLTDNKQSKYEASELTHEFSVLFNNLELRNKKYIKSFVIGNCGGRFHHN